jgi:alginate O-acetyltransferase complex protein AlgI
MLGIERAIGAETYPARRSVFYAVPTMLVVIIGWVLFRSPNIAAAGDMYAGMIGLNGFGWRPEVSWQIASEGFAFMLIGASFIYAEPFLSRLAIPDNVTLALRPLAVPGMLATSALAMASVLRISEQSFSPFLYFQF